MARFQREKGINLSRAVRIGCQAVGFAGRTSVHLATGILAGTAATINTAPGALNDVCHGRTEKAFDRVGRRVDQVVAGFGQALDGTAQLVEDAAKAPSPEAFLSNGKNARRAAFIASLGIGALAGASLLDSSGDADVDADVGGLEGMPEGTFTYASLPEGSVENGMFVGDESDLEALIDAGKDPTAEHVEAEDSVRDPGVRTAFLAQHGYDELPEGYEVHHIQPISEGGADSVDNMILVSEAEHDEITAAHREYYGWKA